MKARLTLIAVSSNTNSFGLRGHLFLSSDGRAWEACRSAYTSGSQYKRGDVLEFDISPGGAHISQRLETWESTRALPPVSPGQASKIIREAKRAAESVCS